MITDKPSVVMECKNEQKSKYNRIQVTQKHSNYTAH